MSSHTACLCTYSTVQGGKKEDVEGGVGEGGGGCRSLCSPPSNPRFPVKPRMHDQTHLNDLAEAGLLVEAGGGRRVGLCARWVTDLSAAEQLRRKSRAARSLRTHLPPCLLHTLSLSLCELSTSPRLVPPTVPHHQPLSTPSTTSSCFFPTPSYNTAELSRDPAAPAVPASPGWAAVLCQPSSSPLPCMRVSAPR